MPLLRIMLSLIVAAAVALAPFTPIWIGQATAKIAATETDEIGHAAIDDARPVGAVHESMDDCAGMMGGAGVPDCPYCDKGMACSPEVCLAKCFHFVGLTLDLHGLTDHASNDFGLLEYAHPPDWSNQPQAPPPRT